MKSKSLMQKRLLLLQFINVIAITNLVVTLFIEEIIGPVTFKFSIIFYGLLIAASVIAIIFYSVKFISQFNLSSRKFSSDFSPVYKFLVINPALSVVFILIILAFFYDIQLLKISLLVLIVIISPVIAFFKSKFLVIVDGHLRIYSFSGDYFTLVESQIIKVKSSTLGLMYRLKYVNDGHKSSVLFFPKANFFVFVQPKSVKELKSFLGLPTKG